MDAYKTQSELLKAISHPARLAILDILHGGEQCVCHIEAALDMRQAYISQQLMTLKDAGLVESRRDGLNLYYHVVKPGIFDVLDSLGSLTDTPRPAAQTQAGVECPCPKCNTKTSPKLVQITVTG
jgi:ArsR family transcriptional regulator